MSLAAAPQALALSKHVFSASMSFAGSGANALSNPSDVAVEQSTGDVWVTDPANHRVEKFSSSGHFILMIGSEVNATTGADLCTAQQEEEGDQCQPGAPATTPGAFTDPTYLAVDNSNGDVYVADSAAGPGATNVQKFDPEGNLIASWAQGGRLSGSGVPGGQLFSGEGGEVLTGIAVDPAGKLYAYAASNFFEFAADGAFIAEIKPAFFNGDERLGSGLAVDGADNLYRFAGLFNHIVELSSEGAALGFFAQGKVISGLALDPATRDLYTTSVLDGVDRFAGSCVLAEGPCNTPLETFGKANLKKPEGLSVDSSTETAYVADTGNKRVAVFTAEPYLPRLTASATSDTATSAHLNGSVDPARAGEITECRFEYAPVSAFNEIQTLTIGATGTGNLTAASKEVTGLTESVGKFVAGEAIEAPGIPAGTTIVTVGSGALELSEAAELTTAAAALTASPTGGTYALSFRFPGDIVLKPIPFNISAEALENALELLPQAGPGTFAVTGEPGGPYRIEFTGSLAGYPQALLTAYPERQPPEEVPNSEGLIPAGATITPAILREGGRAWATAATPSCEPALPYSKTEPTAITAEPLGLEYGTTYEYRLRAANKEGTRLTYVQTVTTRPHPPQVDAESISAVQAETAKVNVQINPGGGEATYHTHYYAEYIEDEKFKEHEFEGAETSPVIDAGGAKRSSSLVAPLTGLPAGTLFHYRVVATNECEPNAQCTVRGQPRIFATLPFIAEPVEPCANSHVRQQTGAAGLLDCRAYELASAADTTGYDVESDLVPGQTPFASYPQAEGRVLYGVHDGGIPATGEPTNRGVDPYLAVRGAKGWSTEYVGIPAGATPSTAPFGSPLLEADASLDSFAFGGPGLCSPCFSEGIETGIPVRKPGGELVQGMAGPEEPASTAKPDGYIAEPLSANGEHLIFGSTSRFAPGGNSGGDISIYDRNLKTGETHVVSNTSEGEDFPVPLPCIQGEGQCNAENHDSNGISELAVSADGSRILLGQKVSEDADHNVYWHLYMDVGDQVKSIDLTPEVISTHGGPGLGEGVLFDGMSADGSKVFFTTKDALTTAANQDTDHSPDVYQAEIGESSATLTRISTGEAPTGNTDACDPVANSGGPHWNAIGTEENCGAVAIGGGGGVAAESGDVYFLSPEQLQAGKGTQNQPNLYLAAPGQPPRFIATLEPDNPLVLDAVTETGTRHTADFQIVPNGSFAAFPSTLALAGSGEETEGHAEIYRYDATTEALACASCSPTGEPSTAGSTLAKDGLSLTEDGRLFFTTTAQLSATDTDNKKDVYEWEPQGTGNCTMQSSSFSVATGDCLALVSAGTGAADSGLLGVSANSKDAYFFTRDSLVPQDKNGPTMKVYDARVQGGFPYTPPAKQCQASDECHGPSSPLPPPLAIGSESGTPSIYKEEPNGCKKGFVLKYGKCVKPHPRKHKHHRRGGASKRSKSGSSASRAKTKHLQRASHKRGGKK